VNAKKRPTTPRESGAVPSCDLSTHEGRFWIKFAIEGMAVRVFDKDADETSPGRFVAAPDALKDALLAAVEAYPWPKGRRPLPPSEQSRRSLRALARSDPDAPRGQKTARVNELATKIHRSPQAAWDRLHRPVRKRTSKKK
jgi:hypothetical protein